MNFNKIGKGFYKRIYRYYSYQSRKILYYNKINGLVRKMKCKPLSSSQIIEIKKYYASFGLKNINTNWHRYYTHISGNFYKEYIPEDIFFNIIEPNLNMMNMTLALTDKNLLNKIIKGIEQPKTIIKNINGFFYFEDENEILNIDEVVNKCNAYSKLVIKPTIGSNGGNDVIVFSIKDNRTDYKNLTILELINLYDKNFIIQNWIEQHSEMSLLNYNSVNTIRSKTLMINGEVKFLSDLLRIGGEGAFVDNTTQGGIFCVIKPDGSLCTEGFNSNDEVILETQSKIKFKDFVIPEFSKIKEVIKKLHLQIPYFKMVSWDIAVNSYGEPVLVEFNVMSQGVNSQFAYGPLFGKYTDDILNSINYNKFQTEVRHILNVSYT